MNYRQRKCAICRVKFQPRSITHKACSPDCAEELAKCDREKKERKALRVAKQKIKSRAEYMKEAQAAFNKFIRLRDHHEPCISCGRHHQGQYHAGHYRSVGSTPELRFDERNCHKQCSVCNNYLSGNLILYRINLIQKIGLAGVESLESKHEPKHYATQVLIEITKHYKAEAKRLELQMKEAA